MARTSSSRAFTLMELLVVIAIIGILMALLFPAVGAAINTAKRGQAKNDATQIATALQGYYTEYGRWPSSISSESEISLSGQLLDAIRGSNSTDNPRQIVFMEVNNYKKGKSGVSGGAFVDPWKQEYKIVVDQNYDNKISIMGTNLQKTVGVYTKGVPKSGSEVPPGTPNSDPNKYVKSWE